MRRECPEGVIIYVESGVRVHLAAYLAFCKSAFYPPLFVQIVKT